MIASETGFYVTGGTLRLDAPSYVERDADRQLFDALLRGEFCYVLTSRQMGKSSLMVRTAIRLRQQGIAVAVLDLTALGQNLSVEQWYDGLLGLVGLDLDLEDELEAFWRAHERQAPLVRWLRALREVVLPLCAGRVVLFLDEIDAVRSLPFSTDEFFAGIRECYNRRTADPEFERLTFCLLGVATPSDLIQDTRTTPFNIGRRIELTDFSEGEAAPLVGGLGHSEARGSVLLKRILYWTGGHPYLTQRLCQAIASDPSVTDAGGVDRLCEGLLLSPRARGSDDNLLFVRDRLLRSEADLAALLDLYARVRRGERVRDEDTNRLIGILGLSGVTRVTAGYLRVRNRIYERVFDREWVTAHMPDAELRRQRAAYRKGLLRTAAVAGVIIAAMAALVLSAVRSESRARRMAEARQQALLVARSQAEKARRAELSERGQREAAQRAERKASRSAGEALASARTAQEAAQRAEAERQKADAARRQADMARLQADDNAHRAQLQQRLAEAATQRERQAIRRALGLLSSTQLDRGVRLLEEGNSLGLLDLLQARETAADLPQSRGPLATVWAGWYGSVDGRLAGVVGHGDAVLGVAFSPDGKRFATASADGTARLWETATGQPWSQPLRHQDRVYAVAFSPDGSLLATGSEDHTVRIWETATGQPHGKVIGDRDAVYAVAFSPDGKLLATGGYDNTARLWETATGQPYGKAMRHANDIWSVAFSPDGKWLATASGDNTVKLWETATGSPRGQPLPHPQRVLGVAISSDGKLLATAATDGMVRVWDAASGRPLNEMLRHQASVNGVAFSPDGKLLATASTDNTARLWKMPVSSGPVLPYGPPLRQFRHPQGGRLRVTFSPDGKLLATTSLGGIVRLWETASGQSRGAPLPPGCGNWRGVVVFSPDGKRLATGSDDGLVRLWDTATGHLQTGPFPQKVSSASIAAMAFSPGGELLATLSEDGTAQLWETATGHRHGQPSHAEGGFYGAAFSRDGKQLAGAWLDGMVRLWEPATGRPHGPPLRVRSACWTVAFSPHEELLAASLDDGTVPLWETATGRPHGEPLRQPGAPTVAFSPDGKLIAAGTVSTNTARLWETSTGQPYGPPLVHPAGIWGVAFSPDGTLLATGSEDHIARLWRLPSAPPGLREMELRTWEALGARLNGRGGVEAIPWQEWQKLRQDLQARIRGRAAEPSAATGGRARRSLLAAHGAGGAASGEQRAQAARAASEARTALTRSSHLVSYGWLAGVSRASVFPTPLIRTPKATCPLLFKPRPNANELMPPTLVIIPRSEVAPLLRMSDSVPFASIR